jgi:hypothetical protein
MHVLGDLRNLWLCSCQDKQKLAEVQLLKGVIKPNKALQSCNDAGLLAAASWVMSNGECLFLPPSFLHVGWPLLSS